MSTALYYLLKLVFVVALLHWLVVGAAADRTALSCTTDTYVNATALISTAGQYDVSCTNTSEWFVLIMGCAGNGTSGNGVVSIQLFNSPTQVLVTDNVSLTPNTTTATLAGCSVDITYLSDTVIPSDATLPHVYVSSTSFMGNISVVLLATLYLERAFIAILGNNSGGIESVALRCDQGSSIVCRRSICSPSLGTSLIVLGPGCPQIGALSVHLNGTNVTGSMWLRTDFTSASSFSFVLIDNFTLASVTQAPRANFIVAEHVQGLMVLSDVVGVRLLVSGIITTIDGYDMGQGSVIMKNCTVADNPSSGSPIFWFANVATVQIVLINVSCTGYFLFALFPTTTIDTNSAKSVKIRIVNSSMRSIGRFLFFSVPNAYNGTVITRNVLSMSAEDSTFMLDGAVGLGAELLQFYSFANSALSSVPPALITVSILFSHCTVNATINSVKLLYTSPGSQSPLPTLHNSSIVFEDSVVYQTWETYVSYFGTVTPPVPLIQADLNKTSIVITRCNIFVQQVSSPIDPAVALLLSVSNAMTTSSLHFINSSITVATNITSPLRTFPISINAMSSSNITVINTTLTNLLALVQLRNTSSPLNRNAIVDVGCSNSWCTPVDNRPCAPVALRYVLTTAPPPDVVVAVCSHSWSGSAAGYSVTSSSTQNTQPPSLSFSYSTSSTEPRGTASVANSATIAKDAVSLFLSMTASEIIKSSTVSVLLSVTANESINASPSVAASVSISTSRQNNSISSSTSPSTYNWSATESKLVPSIAVNDLLPPAAVQAFVVAAAAPLASVALSTSVAGVLQRNFIALRFSGCASSDTSEPNGDIDGHQRGQFMSVSENPTRLSFGVSAGAMYRGAAAGNMLLFAAACALIVPLGLVYSRCEKKDAGSAPRTLATSLGKLRLPGRAFVVPAVLLQPTVTAAAGLLMLSPLLAGDVVLSVVTMGVLVLLVGAPAWVVLRGCRVLVTAVDIPFRGGVVDYIAGRRVAWVPQSGLPLTGGGSWLLDRSVAGAECFALQFNSFICRVGSGAWRELYFLFGCLWSVVTGVVGALDPNDLTSCYVAQITLVAVPALSLITLLVVRPFVSPFDSNLHTVLDILSLAVAILSCVNEGQAAQSVSYVEVVMSTGASLVRILLQYLVKKGGTSKVSSRDTPPNPESFSPMVRKQSQKPRQSVVLDNEEHLQHEIISSDSSTRQDQIHAVIHNAELPADGTIPLLNPAIAVAAAGEEMYQVALEYATRRHGCSATASPPRSSDLMIPLIPLAVQRRHLLRLVVLAKQLQNLEKQ